MVVYTANCFSFSFENVSILMSRFHDRELQMSGKVSTWMHHFTQERRPFPKWDIWFLSEHLSEPSRYHCSASSSDCAFSCECTHWKSDVALSVERSWLFRCFIKLPTEFWNDQRNFRWMSGLLFHLIRLFAFLITGVYFQKRSTMCEMDTLCWWIVTNGKLLFSGDELHSHMGTHFYDISYYSNLISRRILHVTRVCSFPRLF